jgi:hypothetical protein
MKQRKDNFIAFPVPMPFRALTWTRTFVALDLKSGMFWYCDSIANKGWAKNMKWVTPQEVRPWFTFGAYDEDQNLIPRACGFQMKSQGYKTFTFLTDSYSNQEIWMEKFSQSITGKLDPHTPPSASAGGASQERGPSPTHGRKKAKETTPPTSSESLAQRAKAFKEVPEKRSGGGSASKIHLAWKRQDARKK